MRAYHLMSIGIRLFLLTALFFLLAACQAETAAPPTRIIQSTDVAVISETSVPLLPTDTPTLPPAPTVTSERPTVEPAAEQLPATAQPTATAVIAGLIGPDNFAADVNPLTGETVSDPALLARRPIAVKISNAPSVVRPQAGLNSADLIFEHYAEGGLTRFTALFYSKDANPIGSIRSGRLIDLEIPRMYDAAFAYSGSAGPVRLMFRDSDFFERIISPDFAHGGFFRIPDPNKAFEHTLFTDTPTLRFILSERGQNRPPQFSSNMAFRVEPLTIGQPASRVEIGYEGTYVTWSYNSADGRYYRWSDGVVHIDANSGQQLNFKNIIVLGAHHEDTTILEDNVAGGHYSIQIQIWGEGPVSIFRNGQRFDGRWRREEPQDMLTFYDLEGSILPLATGNSFFQLVPLGFDRLLVTP